MGERSPGASAMWTAAVAAFKRAFSQHLEEVWVRDDSARVHAYGVMYVCVQIPVCVAVHARPWRPDVGLDCHS